MAETLIDDRAYPGGYAMTAPTLGIFVEDLHEKHFGKSPKHYTIDSPTQGE